MGMLTSTKMHGFLVMHKYLVKAMYSKMHGLVASAKVYGNAKVCGSAIVEGETVLSNGTYDSGVRDTVRRYSIWERLRFNL